MKQITLLILNTLSLLYALIMNGMAGSPVFNGKTGGSVSAQYDTLFAPAGYAFAIWGLNLYYWYAIVTHARSGPVVVWVLIAISGGQRYSPIDLKASREAGITTYDDSRAFSEQLPYYYEHWLTVGRKVHR